MRCDGPSAVAHSVSMGERARSSFLVGRDDELERLDGALARVSDGRGRTIVCLGDAGIGKTRLAAEFGARHEKDTLVVSGGCVELGDAGLPYGPIAEALRSAWRQGRLDREHLSEGVRAELTLLVPDIGSAQRAARPDEGELGRVRLFEAILAVFEKLAAERPLVVVVEDLHWADRSTLGLIAFLTRNLADTRCLMLTTARPDALLPGERNAATLGEMLRRAEVERLDLGPLDLPATARLVEALAGAPVTAGVAGAIHDRSDGNPFYIEELVASGVAGANDEARVLSIIPPTLRDILLTRLARLSPLAQRVVGAAAVCGRVADERLVELVADLPAGAFVDGLRDAMRQNVLMPAGTLATASAADGAGSIAFRHALMREAAYGDLLQAERREQHLRAAIGLGGGTPVQAGHAVVPPPATPADTAGRAALVAFHLDRADEPAATLVAALDAARAAEKVAGYATALAWYTRALELHDALALPCPPGWDVAAIAMAAADAAEILGDARHAATLSRRAFEATDRDDLARRAHLAERLSEHLWSSGSPVKVDELQEILGRLPKDRPTRERAVVLMALGNEAAFAGDLERSLDLFERAAADAHAVGAVAEETYALSNCAFTSGWTGDVARTLAFADRALAQLDSGIPPFRRLAAEGGLVGALSFVGQHQRAIDLAWEAVRRARQGDYDRSSGGVTVANATDSLIAVGRPAEALAMIDTVRMGGGSPYIDFAWLASRIRALGHLGRFEEVDRAIEQLDRLEAGDNVLVTRGRLWTLVEAAALADRPLRVREYATRLHEVRTAPGVDIELDILFVPLIVGAEADLAGTARARRDATGTAEAARQADRAVAIIQTNEARRLARSIPDFDMAIRVGELERRRVDDDDVATDWLDIATAADALGLVPIATRARLRAVSRLLVGDGTRADARRVLRDAHDTALEAGLGALVRDSRALATRGRIELAADVTAKPIRVPRRRTASASHDPYGLTPREREILTLLAAGYSNRRIGEHLFVSPKTAGVHVSNILGKLGVAGRVEAAVIAHRLGLGGDVEDQVVTTG